MRKNDCGHDIAAENSVLRCDDCEAEKRQREDDALWNQAVEAGIAAILKRCCSHMAKLGHCHHQPCDYYQNALGELRALKRGGK